MSESGNIDIESFRRSRWQKLCDRAEVLFGWLRKRGWVETEAEVIDCIAAKSRIFHSSRAYDQTEGPVVSGYVVTFTYEVDGNHYEATTISPEEFEVHSKIKILYNPRHPAQNDSFESETDWVKPLANLEVVFALGILLIAVVLYCVAQF